VPKQSALLPAADDPRPALRWKVLYDDRFDREAPVSTEVEGRGLVPGLAELWARFLFETVQTASSHRDGGVEEIPSRGFSEFRLIADDIHLEIDGSLAGATRLKHWMFPTPNRYLGIVEGAESQLLRELAETHARAGSIEDAALAILDAAEAAADRAAFVVALGELRRRWEA
jgi:hypothetical protein